MKRTFISRIVNPQLLRNVESACLLILLAIPLSVNITFWWHIKKQNNAVAATHQSSNSAIEGKVISQIAVSDLVGKQETISLSGNDLPTVLYIFTPDCHWCSSNVGKIKSLVEQRQASYRFIGLSLLSKDLQEYLSKNKMGFPIYKDVSQESVLDLELGFTPQTIVISHDGRILKSWVGAYEQNIKNEVESYFGVRFSNVLNGQGSSMQGNMSMKSCVYCIHEGHIYSPGAFITNDRKRLRCKDDSKWGDG